MYRVLPFLATLLFSYTCHSQEKVIQFDNSLNQFQNVRDFCISENGTEAFFSIQSPNQDISQIAFIHKEKKKWGTPELMPFCDEYMYLEPFLSTDGKRLYFASDRPLTDTARSRKDFDIWYVERAHPDSAWSPPVNMGAPINTELNEFYPSVCSNNNLYFTMESSEGLGKDDIYYSKWNGKNYDSPQLLPETINSEGYEFNAFISRDERFLIFTKYMAADGLGSGDLYLSVRDANGTWQKATNLGKSVNSAYMDYCPFYDEKKQILYFTSKRVSLQPKKFKNIPDFQDYVVNGNNGLSKIYMIAFKISGL